MAVSRPKPPTWLRLSQRCPGAWQRSPMPQKSLMGSTRYRRQGTRRERRWVKTFHGTRGELPNPATSLSSLSRCSTWIWRSMFCSTTGLEQFQSRGLDNLNLHRRLAERRDHHTGLFSRIDHSGLVSPRVGRLDSIYLEAPFSGTNVTAAARARLSTTGM
jgi:hypothetical protein